MLSESCRKIIKYELGDLEKSIASWKFPKKIKSAEGLVVLDEENFIVAVDIKKNASNIFLLKAKKRND